MFADGQWRWDDDALRKVWVGGLGFFFISRLKSAAGYGIIYGVDAEL